MKRGIKKCLLLIMAAVMMWAEVSASETGVAASFNDALIAQDHERMLYVVAENLSRVPAELDALLDKAFMDTTSLKEKKEIFLLAETMAAKYENLTDNITPLMRVKRRIFESHLGAPQAVTKRGETVVIDMISTASVKNAFAPDNIVINAGQTVRWINSDRIDHLLGSMPVIGAGGLLSPAIPPGESWEYTFSSPGEYYYICFIHRIMYGKITVR